jgi:membrane associated rhomboid family serine protease
MSDQQTGVPETPVTPVCYRHPGRETYVRCTRCDRPICPDCMNAASVGFQCPECVREGQRSVRAASTAFGGSTDGARGDVTRVLVWLNVAIWVLTVVAGLATNGGAHLGDLLLDGGGSRLTENGAAIPYFQFTNGLFGLGGISAGEYYRLLTSGFLHYGAIHLAMNMYALWILGRECERLIGRWRYLTLYLIAGIGGAVGVYLFAGPTTATAGASGSIFGLLGALFFFFRKIHANIGGLVGLIAINLVITFTFRGYISVWGHVGGLVVGGAVGAVLAYAPRGKSQTALQLIGVAIIAVGLVVLVIVRTAAIQAFVSA